MRRPLALWGIAVLATVPLAGAASAQTETESIAEVLFSAGRVEWLPKLPYELLVLTVSAPDGTLHRQELAAGVTPSFDLGRDGKSLPDGSYTWELRLAPKTDPAILRQVAAARRQGREEAVLAELRSAGKLPARPPVQSGHFQVQGGALLGGGEPEPRNATNKTTVADDLIVQGGNACIGVDCASDESFLDENLRLKDNVVQLHFWDTSTLTGYPSSDWQIDINDIESGGVNRFSIRDLSYGETPFTIRGGAPANSIYVHPLGRVGFGTSTPYGTLHVADPYGPILALEKMPVIDNLHQTWLVTNSPIGFTVEDYTHGTMPVLIEPEAPDFSLKINPNGWVGLGTNTPGGQLHIFGGATGDAFAGMGPDLASGPGFNYGYAGGSFGRSAGFFNIRPDASATAPNPSLRFMTANVQRLIIDNEGYVGIGVANPAHPIHLASGAHVTAGGTWVSVSTREAKQDVAGLSAAEALETLTGLDPVKYAYKVEPEVKHVGFIAEDVPGLVATPDRKGLSALDIVAVLTKVVQEQQKTIEGLTARLEELEKNKAWRVLK
jgi:hypothetical protein